MFSAPGVACPLFTVSFPEADYRQTAQFAASGLRLIKRQLLGSQVEPLNVSHVRGCGHHADAI
jgi:hypothetical protein